MAIFMISGSVTAQVDWVKPTAEIEDAQVVIEKDKVINLNGVSRRFEAIPIELPKISNVAASYNIKKINIVLPPMVVKIRPQTMKPELLQKFFWGTVKAGYGNYRSSYLSASFGTKRSDESNVNVQLNHLSSARGPVDGKNSAAGITDLNATGKVFLNTITVGGELGYARAGYHFYGYDTTQVVDRDSIRQHLNKYHVRATIANSTSESVVDYTIGIQYDFINDDYKSKESDFGVAVKLKSILTDNLNIRAVIAADFIGQSDAEVSSVNRRYIKVKPILGYNWDDFFFELGLGYFNDNDSLSFSKTNHFYPHLGVHYKYFPAHAVKLTYQGREQRVTLRELYGLNPYLGQHINVNNTVNPVSINLSFDGNFNRKVGYQIGYQFDSFKRIGYFVNTSPDSTRFDVVYDLGNSTRNQFFAEVKYTQSASFQISARINTYGYSTVDVVKAWHRPAYDASVRTNFFFFDKIGADINLFLLGGINAQEPITGAVVKLDNVIDINVELDYAISPRASVFAKFLNLLSNEYQLYLNYPVKGFQAMIGFAYNF